MLTYVLFPVGFILLIKGADYLVDGSSSIAKKFHISDLVIGLTIVSFGTSAPEFVVNVLASLSGSTELAFGNIIGSNIANTLLILGVAALIFPLPVQKSTAYREMPFNILASFVIIVVADSFWMNDNSATISRNDGLLLLCFFAIFLFYVYTLAKKTQTKEDKAPTDENIKLASAIAMVIAGSVGLVLGGKWIVDGAVLIAKAIGMSEATIGLTIVAVGTSLPELAASCVAAYKKNADIAVGNVVGSNIFNIFWVLGLSAVINPLAIGNNFNLLMILLGTSLLLFLFPLFKKRFVISRFHGIVFLGFYTAYIIKLLV